MNRLRRVFCDNGGSGAFCLVEGIRPTVAQPGRFCFVQGKEQEITPRQEFRGVLTARRNAKTVALVTNRRFFYQMWEFAGVNG